MIFAVVDRNRGLTILTNRVGAVANLAGVIEKIHGQDFHHSWLSKLEIVSTLPMAGQTHPLREPSQHKARYSTNRLLGLAAPI
jgi:hypothetical protein